MGPVISPYSVLSDMGQRLGQQMVADREAQRRQQQTLAESLSPAIADAARLGALGDPRMFHGLQQMIQGMGLEGLGQRLAPTRPSVDVAEAQAITPKGDIFEEIATVQDPFDPRLMRLVAGGVGPAKQRQDFLLSRALQEQKQRQEVVGERLQSMDQARFALAQTAPVIEETMQSLSSAIAGPFTLPSIGGSLSELRSAELGRFIEDSLSSAEQTQLRNRLATIGRQLRDLPGTTPTSRELAAIGDRLTTRMPPKVIGQTLRDLYRVFEVETIASAYLDILRQEGAVIDAAAIEEAYQVAHEEQRRPPEEVEIEEEVIERP